VDDGVNYECVDECFGEEHFRQIERDPLAVAELAFDDSGECAKADEESSAQRKNARRISSALFARGGRVTANRRRRNSPIVPQPIRVQDRGNGTQSNAMSADDAWAKIGEIPDNIYGVGGRLRNFLRREYGLGNANPDFSKFAEDFRRATANDGKRFVDVRAIVESAAEEDAIDVDALRRSMIRIVADDEFKTNGQKQQIFVRLHRLFYNENGLLDEVKLIRGRSSGESKRRVEGLSIFADGLMATKDLRRLALEAVVVDQIRQEPHVGSCFAVAPLIKMQMDDTAMAMRLCRQMLCDGGIPATNVHGATIFVQTNCYEFVGQGHAPAKILQHAMARTLADASALCGYRPMDPSAENFLSEIDDVDRLLRHIDPKFGKISCDISYDSSAVCVLHEARNIASEIRGIWVPHITIDGNPNVQSLISSAAIPAIVKMVSKYEHELQERLSQCKKEARAGKNGLQSEIDELEEKIAECQVVLSKLSHISRSYRAVGGGWPDHIVNLLGAGSGESAVDIAFIGKTHYGSCEEVFHAWFRVMVAENGEPARILACGTGHAYTVAPVYSTRLMGAIKGARASGDVDGEFNCMVAEMKRDGGRIMFIDPNYEELEGVGIGMFGGRSEPYLFVRRDGVDYPFCSTTKGCDCFFSYLATYKSVGGRRGVWDKDNAGRHLVAA
jgi:hypothetical protein